MTMVVSKVHENSPTIKVGITYGPVSAYVEEDFHHLRRFHTQLGQLLDEMEAKAAADARRKEANDER